MSDDIEIKIPTSAIEQFENAADKLSIEYSPIVEQYKEACEEGGGHALWAFTNEEIAVPNPAAFIKFALHWAYPVEQYIEDSDNQECPLSQLKPSGAEYADFIAHLKKGIRWEDCYKGAAKVYADNCGISLGERKHAITTWYFFLTRMPMESVDFRLEAKKFCSRIAEILDHDKHDKFLPEADTLDNLQATTFAPEFDFEKPVGIELTELEISTQQYLLEPWDNRQLQAMMLFYEATLRYES